MDKKATLKKVIALNMLIVLAEIIAGIMSNSMALLADAFHNLGDILALIISLVAIVYGAKEATSKMTFGYIRAESMAAFVNSLFLIITMAFILFESFKRFFEPSEVNAPIVMIAAFVALLANAFSTYLLFKDGIEHHHHEHNGDEHEECEHKHDEDLNIRSAYLHMLGDAVISLSVVVGGALIYFFGVTFIDPLLSMIFSLYIIKESYPILKKSLLSLMDSSPFDTKKVESLILESKEVRSLHDLHLNSPSSGGGYGSVHIVFMDDLPLTQVEAIIEEIRKRLYGSGFVHFVIQPESSKYHSDETLCHTH